MMKENRAQSISFSICLFLLRASRYQNFVTKLIIGLAAAVVMNFWRVEVEIDRKSVV